MGFGCLAAAGLVWGGLGVSVLLDGLFRVGWGSVVVVLVDLPVFWEVLGWFWLFVALRFGGCFQWWWLLQLLCFRWFC